MRLALSRGGNVNDGIEGVLVPPNLPDITIPDGTLIIRREVEKEDEYFIFLYQTFDSGSSRSLDFNMLQAEAPRLATFAWPLLEAMKQVCEFTGTNTPADLRRLEVLCRGADACALFGSPNNGLNTNMTMDVERIKAMPLGFFNAKERELQMRLAVLRWYLRRYTHWMDARSRLLLDPLELDMPKKDKKKFVRTLKCPDCKKPRRIDKIAMDTCSDSRCPCHYWWSLCIYPPHEEAVRRLAAGT
jgi:hypothetical protein